MTYITRASYITLSPSNSIDKFIELTQTSFKDPAEKVTKIVVAILEASGCVDKEIVKACKFSVYTKEIYEGDQAEPFNGFVNNALYETQADECVKILNRHCHLDAHHPHNWQFMYPIKKRRCSPEKPIAIMIIERTVFDSIDWKQVASSVFAKSAEFAKQVESTERKQ